MLQLVKQITAAGAVSISQTNTITTGKRKKQSAVFMHETNSYYDMGVAMFDYVIVNDYVLHVWGPLELQLIFVVHWVIKRK